MRDPKKKQQGKKIFDSYEKSNFNLTTRTKGIFEIFWTPSHPGIDQCVSTLLCICLTEERKILTIRTLSAEEKSLTTYLTLQKVIAVQNLEPLVTSSCHISEWILLHVLPLLDSLSRIVVWTKKILLSFLLKYFLFMANKKNNSNVIFQLFDFCLHCSNNISD